MASPFGPSRLEQAAIDDTWEHDDPLFGNRDGQDDEEQQQLNHGERDKLFAILNLPRDCSMEDVKKSYRRLAGQSRGGDLNERVRGRGGPPGGRNPSFSSPEQLDKIASVARQSRRTAGAVISRTCEECEEHDEPQTRQLTPAQNSLLPHNLAPPDTPSFSTAILHPDRHSSTSKSIADAKFAQLQHAFEVLSDPHKRAVYEELGEEGLKTQWEVGVRGRSADEVRRVLRVFLFAGVRQEEGRRC